jgi:hypothetical protein
MKKSTISMCVFAIAVLFVVLPLAAIAQAPPSVTTDVAGTVTVNGVPTDGIAVSGGGGSDVTHNGGKYAFSVTPGTITISATYQGVYTGSSGAFTIENGGFALKDINIVRPTDTPVPGTDPTVTPEPATSGAPADFTIYIPPPSTPTPTPMPTLAPTATPEPTAVPPVATPTPTPAPTPEPTTESTSLPLFPILGGLAVIGVAGVFVYYWFSRKQ